MQMPDRLFPREKDRQKKKRAARSIQRAALVKSDECPFSLRSLMWLPCESHRLRSP
jgi:hypothetical protein